LKETAYFPGLGFLWRALYTANTMASGPLEALGIEACLAASAQNAVSNDKKADCEAAGAAVMNLLDRDSNLPKHL